MPLKKLKIPQCAVQVLSSKSCAGEVTEVVLLSGEAVEQSGYPDRVNLCPVHHQLELMVWGVKKFFEIYPVSLSGVPGAARSKIDGAQSGETSGEAWREALDSLPDDPRLSFSQPDQLEFWLNRLGSDCSDGEVQPRAEFAHLKEASIDLAEARLTDKQLMAVCMVFYGGVTKKRAAQAMNITSQALSDHIKAALKKIEENIIGR
jgi:predicted DNA-binding protein (UPF0251 family)